MIFKNILYKKVSALIIYFALLALFVLFSIKWHGNIYLGLIISETILILVPTIFFIFIFKLKLKDQLLFQLPSKINILITILIAVPVLILVYFLTQLIGYFVNIPPFYEEFLAKLVSFQNASWILIIFTIAFIPAFVEEIFFRGFLLSIFDDKKKFWSIVFVALLFAFFHLDPYRFFQIFLIGILLGIFYKYSQSFFITFLLHFMINFLTILSTNIPNLNYTISWKIKTASLVFSLIIFSALLYIFIKRTQTKIR